MVSWMKKRKMENNWWGREIKRKKERKKEKRETGQIDEDKMKKWG